MPGCCVTLCRNRPEKGFRVFAFPKDVTRRSIWEASVGRLNNALQPWTASKYSTLCEAHFGEDQFESRHAYNDRKLRWNAVPNLLEPRREPYARQPPQDVELVPAALAPHPVFQDHIYPCSFQPPSDTTSKCIESRVEALQPTLPLVKLASRLLQKKERIKRYQVKVRKLRKENRTLVKKQSRFDRHMSRLFNSDQLEALKRGGMRGVEWSPQTVQKALQLHLACGPTGYNFLLDHHYPLPSLRTIQRHLMTVKCDNSTLDTLDSSSL